MAFFCTKKLAPVLWCQLAFFMTRLFEKPPTISKSFSKILNSLLFIEDCRHIQISKTFDWYSCIHTIYNLFMGLTPTCLVVVSCRWWHWHWDNGKVSKEGKAVYGCDCGGVHKAWGGTHESSPRQQRWQSLPGMMDSTFPCRASHCCRCVAAPCCWYWADPDAPDDKIAEPVHLLWALMLLKIYSTEVVLSGLCGVDEDTFCKWAW